VTLAVSMERELEEGGLGPVDAPRYPKQKDEAWWLVVGDPKSGSLVAIKRVPLQMRSRVKLEFPAPPAAGAHAYTLFFMCDSYMGADQEYPVEFTVLEGDGDEGDEEGGAAPMEA